MDISHIMPAGHKELYWTGVLLLFLNLGNVTIGLSQSNGLSMAMANRKYLGKAFKKRERYRMIYPLLYPVAFQQRRR